MIEGNLIELTTSKKDFIEKFKARTKQYSLQTIKIFKRLPKARKNT